MTRTSVLTKELNEIKNLTVNVTKYFRRGFHEPTHDRSHLKSKCRLQWVRKLLGPTSSNGAYTLPFCSGWNVRSGVNTVHNTIDHTVTVVRIFVGYYFLVGFCSLYLCIRGFVFECFITNESDTTYISLQRKRSTSIRGAWRSECVPSCEAILSESISSDRMNDFEFLWLRFNDLTRPPPVAAPIRPPDTLLALFNVGGEDGASSVGVGDSFAISKKMTRMLIVCVRWRFRCAILSTYDPCTPVMYHSVVNVHRRGIRSLSLQKSVGIHTLGPWMMRSSTSSSSETSSWVFSWPWLSMLWISSSNKFNDDSWSCLPKAFNTFLIFALNSEVCPSVTVNPQMMKILFVSLLAGYDRSSLSTVSLCTCFSLCLLKTQISRYRRRSRSVNLSRSKKMKSKRTSWCFTVLLHTSTVWPLSVSRDSL